MTAAVLSVPPGEVLGWTLLSIEAKDIGAQYPHHFKGALRGRTTKWVSVQISQLRSAYSIDVANDHLLLVEAARRGLMPPTAHHPYAEFAALGAAVQRLRPCHRSRPNRPHRYRPSRLRHPSRPRTRFSPPSKRRN